jgi:hypothetical protein
MKRERWKLIRALFDEYIEMYASRDDRLRDLRGPGKSLACRAGYGTNC